MLKQIYKDKPLATILFVGFIFRLIAVLFSKGYGMSDDHFLIIEVPQSWVDGLDVNNWLPGLHNPNAKPCGHSLFYTGLHYYLLLFFKQIGLNDPNFKMYFIRLIHALYSLITIVYGYKITAKLSSEKNAKVVAWLLALLWCFPMLSVRNLVEMVCIPPLIFSMWLIVKYWNEDKKKIFLLAGLIAGLAFSIRFQTSTFIAGMGLAILLNKKYFESVLFGIGAIISVCLIQGGIDFLIWGKPFAEFEEYTLYNMQHANDYIVGDWYNYLLLIAGILIPPISFFIVFGNIINWRKMLVVVLPSLLFLIFHSAFPNKQERFILPIIPFLIIAGISGWNSFAEQSNFWIKRKKTLQNIWVWFWVLNIVVLLILTPSSTKISRVDAMNYLSAKVDLKNFILETSNSDETILMPRFYLKKWINFYSLKKSDSLDTFARNLITKSISEHPNYIVFGESENLENRLAKIQKHFNDVTFETTIQPSYLDKIMHWLNPYGNENQTYFIYKLGNLKSSDEISIYN